MRARTCKLFASVLKIFRLFLQFFPTIPLAFFLDIKGLHRPHYFVTRAHSLVPIERIRCGSAIRERHAP